MSAVPPVLQVNRYVVHELKWESVSVFSLVLQPENGGPRLTFSAGQWVYLHLLNQDGTSWGRAAFSIASAPSESEERLQLAIKVEKDFTKRASQLQPGDIVGVQGPFGVFTLPETAERLVMFAGGIGIAPFRSMLREAKLKNLPLDAVLIYSNRFIEDAVFFEELDDLEREWPRFKAVCTLTGGDTPSGWKGKTGRVDDAMCTPFVQGTEGEVYLMCGPEAFMEQVKSILAAKGIDVKAKLKKELFG